MLINNVQGQELNLKIYFSATIFIRRPGSGENLKACASKVAYFVFVCVQQGHRQKNTNKKTCLDKVPLNEGSTARLMERNRKLGSI